MKTIIWDWNGTLLNDVQICLDVINSMLLKRNLPKLTLERYFDVFGFPVKEYYEKIGFNFSVHNWDEVSHEFIEIYSKQLTHAPLQAGVVNMLEKTKDLGYKNFVLSAMEQKALEVSIYKKQILHFFDGVAGITDHKAHSKIERGKELFIQYKLNKEKVIFIGDTEHDYEVSQALGASCILVANGHHSYKRLAATNVQVVPNLDSLLTIIE